MEKQIHYKTFSHKGSKKSSWMTGEVFRGLDTFGQRLPTFILKGKDKVKTKVGGICTILAFLVVLMFAILKFSHLISRHKPTMFSYLKENDYSINGEEIDLSERKFRIAVTIEDFFAPIAQKNDPKYIKWLFRLYGKRDGVFYQHMLDYHECTDADFDEFYPV